MSRLSFVFFTLSGLSALAGMVWGMAMGASGDHSTLAAHAHLNLLGWVGLGLMGGFHALAGARVPTPLGWTNLALSALGAALLPTAMALLAQGAGPRAVPLVIAGGVSATLGMLAFLGCVLAAWRRGEARAELA